MPAAAHTQDHLNEGTVVREWLAQARLVGEEDVFAGKRRHPRVTWTVPVTLAVLDGPEAGTRQYAHTKDISEGGLGLRARRPIPLGSTVWVGPDDSAMGVHARVMHCTETVGGFVIGISLHPPQTAAQELRRSA